jgi:hypothetical protein
LRRVIFLITTLAVSMIFLPACSTSIPTHGHMNCYSLVPIYMPDARLSFNSAGCASLRIFIPSLTGMMNLVGGVGTMKVSAGTLRTSTSIGIDMYFDTVASAGMLARNVSLWICTSGGRGRGGGGGVLHRWFKKNDRGRKETQVASEEGDKGEGNKNSNENSNINKTI